MGVHRTRQPSSGQPSRRSFLRGAAGLLALGASPITARAGGGLAGHGVPGLTTHYGVLEIFFQGALPHRETWWVEQPDELPMRRTLGGFDPRTNPFLTEGAPSDWLEWLPAANAYQHASYCVGTAGSRAIHLGPCAGPLVAGRTASTSLVPRLRVIATGHAVAVHEVAQALMLQGSPSSRSRDRASGVGAAVSRHRGLPSYVFFAPRSREAAEAAAASGRHGTPPLLIPFGDPTLVTRLAVPRHASRDALGDWYTSDYTAGLTFQATPTAGGNRARSVSYDRYLQARDLVESGPTIAANLSALATTPGNSLWSNGARRAIQASVALLSENRTAYCCVVDEGVNGTFYDTHDGPGLQQTAWVTGNVLSVLRTLREEVDAGRLNLDNTLVVLNSEFGRSYMDASGSEHCAGGFAVAFLGGPIAHGRGGVVGDLPFLPTDNTAMFESEVPAFAIGGLEANRAMNPTDLRAALLLAAGIHPFQPDTYEPSESSAAAGTSADDIAALLAQRLFGV